MKPTTAHVKGTDLVTIKNQLIKKDKQLYETCLNKLSSEAQAVLKNIIANIWIPNAIASEIMTTAAKLLFPGTSKDLEQLGSVCAEHAFTGIYKTFLSIATVPFLLKRVPLVWNMYQSIGQATVKVNDEKQGAQLVVTGAEDVHINNLRLVGGFSVKALEMAGAKNVICQLDSKDRKSWKWNFSWTTQQLFHSQIK